MSTSSAAGALGVNATDWDDGGHTATTDMPYNTGSGNATMNTYLLISVYIIIFLLAVVGNVLVIVTLVQNKRMRTVTNIFLLSLSVSDLLFATLCMPFTLVGNMLERFIFGEAVCKIIPYLQGVSVAVSVWTMCAISLERYHAICNPLASRAWQTKTRACKIIVVVWLLSCLAIIPFAIFTEHRQMNDSEYYMCREQFPSPFKQIYITCIFMALMCIPLLVMCIAYGLISWELWKGMHFEKKNTRREKGEENGTPLNDLSDKSTRGRKSSIEDSGATESFLRKSHGGASKREKNSHAAPRSTSSNAAKKRVVKMLLVLVILFFVCWAPTWCLNVWATFDQLNAHSSVSALEITLIRLLMYISACVNPVVYCFMNKKFRQGFLEAFGCCCCCCINRCKKESVPHTNYYDHSQTSVRRQTVQHSTATNYTNVSSDSSV